MRESCSRVSPRVPFLFFFGKTSSVTHEQRPGSAGDQPHVASCSQITHIFYGLKVLLGGESRLPRLPSFRVCAGSTCSGVYASVCIRISPARSEADPGVCLSAVFGLGRSLRKEAVRVRGPAGTSSTGRQDTSFLTHTYAVGLPFRFCFFRIFVSARCK